MRGLQKRVFIVVLIVLFSFYAMVPPSNSSENECGVDFNDGILSTNIKPPIDLIESAKINFNTTEGFLVLGWALAADEDSVLDEFLLSLREDILKENGPGWITGGINARDYNARITGLTLGLKNPKVLEALSCEEKQKLNLIAKAVIVAGVKSTNYEVHDSMPGRTFDNEKVWFSSNFINPIIGSMISASYMVGQDETMNFLENYTHDDFLNELLNHGLLNLYNFFNELPSDEAERYVNDDWFFQFPDYYDYEGRLSKEESRNLKLDEPMLLNLELFKWTFSYDVPGGANKWGYLEGQPHQGEKGMLNEFYAIDSGSKKQDCEDHAGFLHVPGERDDLGYAAAGWRDTTVNRLLMVVVGDWEYFENYNEMEKWHAVGSDDLFYKIDSEAYESYANGECRGMANAEYRVQRMRPIFEASCISEWNVYVGNDSRLEYKDIFVNDTIVDLNETDVDVNETLIEDLNETVIDLNDTDIDVNETLIEDLNETLIEDLNGTVDVDLNGTAIDDLNNTIGNDLNETNITLENETFVDNDVNVVENNRGSAPGGGSPGGGSSSGGSSSRNNNVNNNILENEDSYLVDGLSDSGETPSSKGDKITANIVKDVEDSHIKNPFLQIIRFNFTWFFEKILSWIN